MANEKKSPIAEFVEVVEELLSDPEVQAKIPAKYKFVFRVALKLIKILDEVL